jgi:hypothetical protein
VRTLVTRPKQSGEVKVPIETVNVPLRKEPQGAKKKKQRRGTAATGLSDARFIWPPLPGDRQILWEKLPPRGAKQMKRSRVAIRSAAFAKGKPWSPLPISRNGRASGVQRRRRRVWKQNSRMASRDSFVNRASGERCAFGLRSTTGRVSCYPPHQSRR